MTARRASKRPAKALAPARSERGDLSVSTLVHDLGALIDAARKQMAVAANAALTTLYWQIGQRVRTEVLNEQRAKYGGQIVSAVGRQLEARYGRGFGEKSLRHMVRFALAFPEPEIVSALRRQLSWSHFRQLICLWMRETMAVRVLYSLVKSGSGGACPRQGTCVGESGGRVCAAG